MSTSTSQPVYGTTYGGSAPENYERFFVPAIGGPLASDLVARAALRLGERVLDVACGTGVVTRLAAERVAGANVAGLDLNGAMLAVARAIPAPAGTTIRWYETSAEAMPLPNGAFDVVLCQLGLQFMTDQPAALKEMRRVLAADGRIVVSVATPNPFFESFESALARYVANAASFVRQVFSLNDEAVLSRLLRDAGFVNVAVRAESKVLALPAPREFLWQYVSCTPLTGMIPAEEELRSALERDVVAAWQPWVSGAGIRYEQGVLVATARR